MKYHISRYAWCFEACMTEAEKFPIIFV